MADDRRALQQFMIKLAEDATLMQQFRNDPKGTVRSASLSPEQQALLIASNEAVSAIQKYFAGDDYTSGFFLFVLLLQPRSPSSGGSGVTT